jgi:uncharacterized membrane protein YkvA (DUF1232 family)
MSDEKSENWLSEPVDDSVFQDLIRRVKLFWRLLKDRRVPLWVKAIPFLSLIYLAVPTDLLPDVFLGLGQLDDLAVLALGYRLFVGMAPPELVREHLDDLIAQAARWRVIDDGASDADDASAAGWMVIDGESERVDDNQP